MALTESQQHALRQWCTDETAFRNLLAFVEYLLTPKEVAARATAEELHETEAKYYQLFELIADAVFLIDNDTGRLLECNAAATLLYGYSREALLQLRNTDLSAQPDETRRITTTGADFVPLRYHKKQDGTVFPVEITGRFFTWHGRQVHIAVIRDVTPRLRVEEQLRASEQRYRLLADLLPVGVVIHARGMILFANQMATGLLGAESPAALIGQSVGRFVHPDYWHTVLRRIEMMEESGTPAPPLEQQFIRVDGSTIQVEVMGVPFPYEDDRASLVAFQDIGARKHSERQELALAMERERVAILAHFIQSASHEFRTPLSVINTSLHLLERVQDEHQRARHRARIAEEVKRLTTLLEDMLMMARLDSAITFEADNVNVVLLLRGLIALWRDEIQRKRLHVDLVLPYGSLLEARGDTDLLRRALTSLFSNAIRYTPEGGSITLMATLDAGQIIIEVRDTGVGIDAATLPRIFDSFFRADEAHSTPGFGLGLPIAHKIIDQHGGRITVESQPGEGSVFRVLLPAAQTAQNMQSCVGG